MNTILTIACLCLGVLCLYLIAQHRADEADRKFWHNELNDIDEHKNIN